MNVASVPPSVAFPTAAVGASSPASTPFSPVYQRIFGDRVIETYHYLDTGPDDALASFGLYGAAISNDDSTSGKWISVIGLVPSYGKAVLSQCEQNALRIVQYAKVPYPNVFSGSRAPWAMQNDPAAIAELEAAINATKYYGPNGFEGVEDWQNVTIPIRSEKGYKFVADMYALGGNYQTSNPLFCSSSLSELDKTLQELLSLERQYGKSPGTYLTRIDALFIDAGTIRSINGTQTPNGSNIMADLVAAQSVFAIASAYNIPVIFCPTQLTTDPGVLYSSVTQPAALRAVNNSVTNKLAAVTEVIPYLEEGFADESYQMSAAVLAEALLDPDLFNARAVAGSLGPNGELIENPNAPKEMRNIYVLDMSSEQKAKLYSMLTKRLANFNDGTESNQAQQAAIVLQVLLGIFGSVLGIGAGLGCAAVICKKRQEYTRV